MSGVYLPPPYSGLTVSELEGHRVARIMLLPFVMRMNVAATGTIAALVLAAAGPACSPQVVVEVGSSLVRNVRVGYMAWSNDNRTLLWSALPDATGHTSLQAADVLSGETHAVLEGFDSMESITFTADGTYLFFVMPGNVPTAVRQLMRVPVAKNRAGIPEPIAINPWWQFVVSATGDRVAVLDADTSELTAIDLRTGVRIALGKKTPVEFSPDGSRLLARTTAPGSEVVSYVLADPSTGNVEALTIPGNPALVTVIRWEGAKPRLVIPHQAARILDLATDEEHLLPPGMWNLAALSGAPAEPTHGYFWNGTCLGTWMPEPGVTLCAANQGILHRVNLLTDAIDIVAKIEGQSAPITVSRDGHFLATNLDFNNGVGNAAIFVKPLALAP